METEGKYSGYKHHPDYKEGENVRTHPKNYKAKSKAKALHKLVGKEGFKPSKFIDHYK